MSPHLLLESALRSLVMGVTVYAALRLLRIHQVRAQRTAWIMALIAALAMPALVGLRIGPRLLPAPARPAMPPPARQSLLASSLQTLDATRAPAPQHWSPAPELHAAATVPARTRPLQLAAALYAGVAGLLLLRLGIGLGMALRLRKCAHPAGLTLAGVLDVRISPQIQTPVTIASSILLPESCAQWDAATRRIVLAHERAHLQQGDFYLQLAAALHCAIFWFNPFAWWLQRRLSALGEAMSDLAAVRQAESRAGYAEVLLAFATRTSYPLTSIAMARTSNLKPRIERLLSDRLFTQSAAGTRHLTAAAAVVVILAITASTSISRVHAAQASTASAISTSQNQLSELKLLDGLKALHGLQALHALNSSAGVGASSSSPLTQTAAYQPTGSSFMQEAVPPTPPPPAAPASPAQADSDSSTSINIDSDSHTHKNGFSYATSRNGDAFALVTGEGDEISFSGSWNDAFRRARAITKGDFIYSRRDGNAYIIQDPAIITRAKALYAPMQQLSRQQAELGAQQVALGTRQGAFSRQIEAVKIPTPDLEKELASLDRSIQQLKQLESKPTVDVQALADLQGRLAELQGRLGELQGRSGEQQGRIGEQQGALGEQQGKIGAQQGEIGKKQGEIAREAQRQLKPLIEQAIRDGKAKPVE